MQLVSGDRKAIKRGRNHHWCFREVENLTQYIKLATGTRILDPGTWNPI
jgi:hypothetical protein